MDESHIPLRLLPRDSSMPRDENLGPIWLAVSTTFLFLLLVTTALRLWCRIGRRNVGWDDTTIAIAAVMAAVQYSFGAMQLPYGNGRHRIYLSEHDYQMINLWGWYGQLFYFTSMTFLKVSICCLVLRIKSERVLRIIIYTIIAGVVVTNMGVVVLLFEECQPAGFWRGKAAKCWPNKIRIYWIYATIAHSVVTDLVLSLIPLTVIWKVKIPSKRKAMITCLMSLGLIATGFGIARAASLGVSEDDLSWTFCIVAIWSNLELFLGILAANLALSRAIYAFFHDKAVATTKGISNPSSSGYLSSRLRGITPGHRRMTSETRSSNSDIPLEPGIKKTTEFTWREDGNGQQSSSASNDDRGEVENSRL
ncbi:integral membrane protein [Colletotrichum plurivorum]|uniref:Integral membrane protein n=1 Tax=Colletotrichum plurivorum TaxID=2175906 RepID=A0A8H6KD77_9PEZI|nr:integral membrane protein [Colletotrichum plurivorum]